MSIYMTDITANTIQEDPLPNTVRSYRQEIAPSISELLEFKKTIHFIVQLPSRILGSSSAKNVPDVYTNGAMITYAHDAFTNGEYFNTQSIDAGIVSLDSQYTFNYTHFFGTALTISSFNITSLQGVTIVSPAEGDTVYPYQSVPLIINIAGQGLFKLAAEIEIELSNGHTSSIFLQAVRSPYSWLFHAQWRDGLSYTRRFLTAVATSDNGTEFRKTLRHTPIRECEIPLTVTDVTQAYFSQILMKGMVSDSQSIPIYTDPSPVQATSLINTFKIYCETTLYRFQEGAYAAVVSPSLLGTTEYEMVEIASIDTDGLTLSYALGRTYPIGSVVYPLEECAIRPDGISFTAETRSIGEITLTATSKYGNTVLENPEYVPTIYNGCAVYPFVSNWGTGTEVQIVSGALLEDSGRGQKNYAGNTKAYSTWDVVTLFKTREEYWEALGFFNYIKGRGKKIFLEYPMDWLPLASVITDSSFWLSDDTFGLDIEGNIKYLFVSNGTEKEVVTIEDIYTSGSGGAVIDTTTPTISGITSIAQAIPVRLSEDDVVETWMTTGIVEISFSVVELPEV